MKKESTKIHTELETTESEDLKKSVAKDLRSDVQEKTIAEILNERKEV